MAKTKTAKPKKAKQKKSFILTISLVFILVYFSMSFVSLQVKKSTKSDVLQQKKAEEQQLIAENARKEEIIDSFGPTAVYDDVTEPEAAEAATDENAEQAEEPTVDESRREEILGSEEKREYIEQLAREKGYVFPGEKVFFDVTPGA